MLINDIDPDAGDSKTVSAVGGLASKVGQAVAGAYGTLTLNADGSYSYVVNNANGSVQGLRTASDTLTDSFTYTVKDLAGVASSTTLKVTIKGANDAPVAVADVNGSDAVKEADLLRATLQQRATFSPTTRIENSGDTKTVVGAAAGVATGPLSGGVGTTLTGVYGTLTLTANGTWTYGLNNSDTDTNALAQGATGSDVFTYTVRDTAGRPRRRP